MSIKKKSSSKAVHRSAKKKAVVKKAPLINFKVEPAIKKTFAANAQKYGMRGNVSEWLRFAGASFRPSKAQIQKWAT